MTEARIPAFGSLAAPCTLFHWACFTGERGRFAGHVMKTLRDARAGGPQLRPVRQSRATLFPGVLVAVFLFGLGATAGRAADADTVIYPVAGAAKTNPPGASIAGGLNAISLLLAAAAAGVGGWALWRGRQRASVRSGARALAVEETRPLGNRQYLVVASYEGRKFLLGVCPGRIDLLAPLTAESARRLE